MEAMAGRSMDVCNRTLEEAQSEVERECEVRRRCFDKWIGEGRISRIDANDRLERMISANIFLKKLLTAAEKPVS
jgi:hypothetical protein